MTTAPPDLPIDAILDQPGSAVPAGETIGQSREGRPLVGYRTGRGPVGISLVAGCHADEPVGPQTLDALAAFLGSCEPTSPWLTLARWVLVPHANPDGEARNASWTAITDEARDVAGRPDRAYRLPDYLRHVVREAPGDDVEFGFSTDADDAAVRPENRAIAAFLRSAAPLHLHASLHGMGLASGPWFLVEPSWVERTRGLRRHLTQRVREMGYRLHDVDRHGEKGFWRIAEGFSTRPDSAAMRDFFLARGEPETAARFRLSSMELARTLGDEPLTLVSEVPLFLLPREGALADPNLPRPQLMERLRHGLGRHGDGVTGALRIRPMPLRDQMRLQLAFLAQALKLLLPATEATE